MTKIYAIIVTYNAMHRNWIDRCMKSLQESTVPVKAVLIDNGSTDGTRDYVPRHFPDAVWLPQTQNLGFGQANNIGLRLALNEGADYALLLNQDAALAPDALEKMLAASDGESLLSPVHLNGDGTHIDEMFRCSLKQSVNLLADDLLIRRQTARSYEAAEICAACWLMPASLIRKIGGFNPLFFHYSEDNNYYHRMVYHHVKTLLVPSAVMYHDRLVQGNIQAFNHKHLRRDLLLEACDINHRTAQHLFHWTLRLVKCYAKDYGQGLYRIGAFTREAFWLLCHANSIRRSRKKEKTIGTNWL